MSEHDAGALFKGLWSRYGCSTYEQKPGTSEFIRSHLALQLHSLVFTPQIKNKQTNIRNKEMSTFDDYRGGIL